MTEAGETVERPLTAFAKLPLLGSLIALVGLADSVYLTVNHYAAAPVPCSLIEGCEKVLTSEYAEIAGLPIAALGAAAYFVAFALALFTAFGHRSLWPIFGILTLLMAAFTAWLVYLQAFVIEAFCQFCLISAGTSMMLFLVFLFSFAVRRN